MGHPKKTWLRLAALFILAYTSASFAASRKGISFAEYSVEAGQPSISVPYRLSLGTVPGSITYGYITVHNDGKDTLRINGYSLLHKAEWQLRDTLGHLIAPDSSVLISLSFKSALPGIFIDTLEIFSNDHKHSVSSITLYGDAVKGQIALPRALSFGKVPADSTCAKSVTVRNVEGGPLLISALHLSSAGEGVAFSLDPSAFSNLPRLVQVTSDSFVIGLNFKSHSTNEERDTLFLRYSEWDGDARDTSVVLIANAPSSAVNADMDGQDSASILGSTLRLVFSDGQLHTLRLQYFNTAGMKLTEERVDVLDRLEHLIPTSVHGLCYIQIEDGGTLRFIRYVGR